MTSFPNRILILGCGSVAQAVIPLLVKDLMIEPSQIVVIDTLDNRDRLFGMDVTYVQRHIRPDNYDTILSGWVKSGDILLDLAWDIDTLTLLDWCRNHGVRYLNTSVEVWNPYNKDTPFLQRTLYTRHMAIRKMIANWGDNKGPTAVLEHGANPGLVSHWVKQSLREIAYKMMLDGIGDIPKLSTALGDNDFPMLGFLTGTKVIHIAERDTQITNIPRRPGEIVNTWSVSGLFEEGIAPTEIGWGTHETGSGGWKFDEGPQNQIILPRCGIDTWVRSWVPSGPIHGMVIRHGEAFTMSEHLTLKDPLTGLPIYRPTVHYAYQPCDSAVASILELQASGYEMGFDERILNQEITAGQDELGVLLMGHPYGAWWTGSVMSIEEARAINPHQSATTMQVAASVVAATRWMMMEPEQGVKVPDDLPFNKILDRKSVV